jgi:hypothetical protein
MEVEIVIAGVVVAVATVPANPFAETTLAVVTVPLPPAAPISIMLAVPESLRVYNFPS